MNSFKEPSERQAFFHHEEQLHVGFRFAISGRSGRHVVSDFQLADPQAFIESTAGCDEGPFVKFHVSQHGDLLDLH